MELPDETAITELRAIAARVRVHIVGEPASRGIVVDGPATLEVDGGRAVVRSDPPADDFFDEVEGAFTRRVRFRLGDWIRSRSRHWRPDIVIRLSPSAAVHATVALGGVEVEGMSGPVRCEVARGAACLRDVQGPVDAVVSTGKVVVRGDLTRGQSTVSCHHGAAVVELTQGADVRVVTLQDPGRAEVEGGTWDGAGWVFGSGAALLTLDLNLGSASVSSISEAAADRTPPS